MCANGHLIVSNIRNCSRTIRVVSTTIGSFTFIPDIVDGRLPCPAASRPCCRVDRCLGGSRPISSSSGEFGGLAG